MLAPYAVRNELSCGRRYPESQHPYRNDFQRDRDRVIHARAFRRLEDKTQVFTRRYSDHFRNRLTHTLEVTQISRTVAGVLCLNVDLVEALALAHDLGHPPFGHAGERALDAAMQTYGGSFDHNLHALHIVEDFERRYIAYPGLNLTFEVREGIIKHSHDYSADEQAVHPELAEYLLELRPPLEAQLIDLTDEIGYSTADLDDGFESGLLTLDQIRAGVPVFDRYFLEVEKRYPAAHAKLEMKLKFNEALKGVLNRLASDLIENTRARVEAAGPCSVDDVRSYPERLAAFSPEVDDERRGLKQFLYTNLYNSAQLEPEKELATRVISELFAHFINHPESLPGNHGEKARRDAAALPRIICDYLAGMTDRYVLAQHKKFCG